MCFLFCHRLWCALYIMVMRGLAVSFLVPFNHIHCVFFSPSSSFVSFAGFVVALLLCFLILHIDDCVKGAHVYRAESCINLFIHKIYFHRFVSLHSPVSHIPYIGKREERMIPAICFSLWFSCVMGSVVHICKVKFSTVAALESKKKKKTKKVEKVIYDK